MTWMFDAMVDATVDVYLFDLLQLDYAGQQKRTKVISKDLDPTWNEKVLIISKVLDVVELAHLGMETWCIR